MERTLYHGTRPEAAEAILREGFDIEAARGPADVGDLGWGVYLSDSRSRSRNYGPVLLEVDVDTGDFARLPRPYFLRGLKETLPETPEEHLFHDAAFSGGEMLTVRGRDLRGRERAARHIRDVFLNAGYDGLIAGPYVGKGRGDHEVVVFNPDTILSVRLAAPVQSNPVSPLQKLGDMMFALGKDLFSRGTVKDTVAWEGAHGTRVAWVMDPRKMPAAGVSHDTMTVPFTGAQAAMVFERHGLKAETLKYEREMVLGDFLPRASNELYGFDENGVTVTIIPEPGYPWPAPDGYYSAKLGRKVRSDRPGWLLPENVVDEGRHIDSPGIDLCKMFPDPIDAEVGAEVGRYGPKPDDFFLVTHAMGTIEGMTRYGSVEGVAGWEENARQVMKCGGLIFPSMAIGPIPATNFGVAVLIADIGVVLNSLKPSLKRGQPAPSAVYSSDAWSGRTASFLTDTAVAAFDQMHGHGDYIYYSDLNVWPLGAPRAWALSGPGELAEEVRSAATLKKELKERFRVWTRELSPEDVERVREEVSLTKARYGYLEAKVNGVMRMSDFPIAAVPPQQEEGFRRFLEMTGFDGELLVVDLPDEILEAMMPGWSPPGMDFDKRMAIQTWAQVQYGWNVADAVREVARELKV